jgi:hypothetical protein
MRGLFFLWRLCGFAPLKLPALGREPATKRNYRSRCILHGWVFPSLGPEPNIGAFLFWILRLLRDQRLWKSAEG